MPQTFIWCCYHSHRREHKVTASPWQGSELMWKSFINARCQRTLCSLAAQLPSLDVAEIYCHRRFLLLRRWFSKCALEDLKAQDVLVTGEAQGKDTPQSGLHSIGGRKAATAQGAPVALFSNQGRWQKKKSEQLMRKAPAPT